MGGTENSREFTRIPIPVQVKVSSPGQQEILCSSRDLAMNGVLLHSDRLLPPGTQCEVRIQLTEGASIEILAFGKVVRTDDACMAIGFDSMDVEGYAHMKNLLMYNAGNADAIEDEVRHHLGLHRR